MDTALLVIDMQNDYLWDARKDMFPYDTPSLVAAVNKAVHEHDQAGCDVIYVRHIIQDLPTNRLLFGYSIENTKGAELYGELDVVSSLCFDKLLGDALSNRELLRHLKSTDVKTLRLCGLDEYGCVAHTALGAAKRGFKAEIIRSGTASVLPASKTTRMQRKLDRAGITFI